ncbi:MAG: aldehyde ferredoxin oxidoreductase family protein [Chloroflexi bacterium]|nr:aldehyde ferredoxin oxidoreductase family protein [Chloroflexota bacterium]
MAHGGYTGKILRVDLTNRKIEIESHDDEFYRQYLGGRGMVAYYLLNELPRHVEPLSPENILVFAAGPLTGAAVSGQGRNGAGAKSPLTDGLGNAEGGGFWGAELKRAGFDGIVVQGRADKPVYLWVHDGQAEVRDAAHLWGKTSGETEDALHAELGDRAIRTAVIGPAGERLVRFAAIVNDRSHFVGRNGLGAVMGSKNLKAIAARAAPGKGRMEIANPAGVQAISKWMGSHLDLVAGLHEHGTARIVRSLSKAGGLPSYNFRDGHFDANEKITGQTMSATILVTQETCFACAVRCKRVVEVKDAPGWATTRDRPYVDPLYGGPEYETLAAFGSLEGNDDLIALAKANELCAAYGFDTISLGAVIAFAMECFERGVISSKETDGMDLRFGNARAMLALIEKITRREGFGDVLAEGVARAAQTIGRGAEEFAMTTRGQEIPMHEPRLKQGLGVGYAVSPTGADHNHNIHDTMYTKENDAVKSLRELDPEIRPVPANDLSADKVRILTANTNWMHLFDSAVMCQFLPYSPQQMTDLMNAVTGWGLEIRDYLQIGERAATLARLYNLREGWDSQGDTLPKRFFEPFKSGPLAGTGLPPDQFAAATREYYRQMGWDENGVPTRERVRELGVEWAV